MSVLATVENLFDVEYDTGRTPTRTIGTPLTARVAVQVQLLTGKHRPSALRVAPGLSAPARQPPSPSPLRPSRGAGASAPARQPSASRRLPFGVALAPHLLLAASSRALSSAIFAR